LFIVSHGFVASSLTLRNNNMGCGFSRIECLQRDLGQSWRNWKEAGNIS